ncbi:hypothetical protein Tco_0798152 [Tanacetum coccineum]
MECLFNTITPRSPSTKAGITVFSACTTSSHHLTREKLSRFCLAIIPKKEVLGRGFLFFLANVTAKEVEDKSRRRRTRTAPVARDNLIDWAPRMKELSEQLKRAIDKRLIRTQFLTLGALVLFVKKKDGSF